MTLQSAKNIEHNRITMFRAWWTWTVPLLGALAAFVGVLLVTPPGFQAIGNVLFGSLRGPNADAAAYALGSAATLALVALIVLAVVCSGLGIALRRFR